MITLEQIVADVRRRLEASKAARSLSQIEALAAGQTPPRDLVASLSAAVERAGVGVIAEVKRRSPSAGWIRPEYQSERFDPEGIALTYESAGAGAISCLTEEDSFSGSLAYIERIRARVTLPVLRKDFIVDPWQIVESRAAGADAVLLIAECLTPEEMGGMIDLAGRWGMCVLAEIHEARHAAWVWPLVEANPGRVLLGINNRDLSSMRVDLAHTTALAAGFREPARVVSESGIKTADDLRTLAKSGVRRVLVGEHLMRQESPGLALARLLE
jgi:indole-3-glycerol phosphate synthase